MAKQVIVGTAGHIDHGKTSLVEALTGTNADRLEEEKRRGITIDIGFAHLDGGPDLQVGFVDVPGHERFVKNMLAGATGIDLALLVVAADESVMPQTREHFDICRLLGIRAGLVALTKADLAPPDLLELARMEVEELAVGSFLEGAPVVAVSSKTGEGVDELRKALLAEAAKVEPKSSAARFRLPIDRVFSVKGFGTVVTGTATAGGVEPGEEVEVYPTGRRARVRGVQIHGRDAEQALAGARTAVNLAGVPAEELRRGMVLSEPGVFRPTSQFDVRVELLRSAKPLKHGAPVHFHIGAAEVEGRVFLLEPSPDRGRRRPLQPGDAVYAQVRLEEPVLALPGDRFVIRRFSPVITIGGGTVLDNAAPRRQTFGERRVRLDAFHSGDLPALIERLVAEAEGGIAPADLIARTALTKPELNRIEKALSAGGSVHAAGPRWLHGERLAAEDERLLKELAAYHRKRPLEPGAPLESLRSGGRAAELTAASLERLAATGKIAVEKDLARLVNHKIRLGKEEAKARKSFIDAFQQAGLTTPTLREFLPGLPVDAARARLLLNQLLREGELVKVTPELVFHRSAIASLETILAKRKAASPRITVPEFKEAAGVSRKYAIPLLEYLDKRKLTRRDGDARIIL